MQARGLSHGTWRGADELPSGDGYRRLSVRVIELALRDLVSAAGSATEADSARMFLAGSPMLRLWCQLAALDPARVAAHAGRLVTNRAALGRTARRIARDAGKSVKQHD